jgi:integrase
MGDLTVIALKAKLAELARTPSPAPVRIGDGGGLHLLVKPGLAARRERREKREGGDVSDGAWVLRYTFGAKRRDMGLGAFPAVGLAEAREAAEEARKLLRRGLDPLQARDDAKAAQAQAAAEAKAKAVTFRDAARETVEAKRGGWSNPKHAAQWLATLEQHAFPRIGNMAVAEVDTAAVLTVLRPIWTTIPETASRLRQRMEAILDLARVRGWRRGENPARWRGLLSEELPPPRKVQRVEHRPALPWQQVPAFWTALAKVEGNGAAALRFAILTAARTGEVRGMTWREVDMEAGLWTVPAGRMKARRAHRVPLSAAALDVLRAIRPEKPKADAHVFPGADGAMLSDMTVSAVIRRMNEPAEGADPEAPPRWRDHEGRAVVPHGFRSTFRDWAGETRMEGREVVERALAHTVRDKAEAAYARSDLLEKRRPIMEAWGAWCCRPAGGAEVRDLAAERGRRTRKAPTAA